jgi:hypothetical protein
MFLFQATVPFFLIGSFIYISNVIPFPGFPFRNPLSHPPSYCLYEGAPPPIPTFSLWHSFSMGHRTPLDQRAAPPNDVQQGHLLPHMRPGLWIPGCVLWLVGLAPGSSGGGVDIVLPMGLQASSGPSVLSLTPTLGSLAASICLCICQALAEPLRRQPYQASISKHFPASGIESRSGDCIWHGFPGGAVARWPVLQSLLHTLSPYFLLYFVVPPPSKKH